MESPEIDKVEVFIPRLKFSFEFEASKTMKEMGLVLPFSSGELTEMVNCCNSDGLNLSSTFQKACIEVNEEGAEAAAVTLVSSYAPCSYQRSIPTPVFDADHPFCAQSIAVLN